MEGAKMTAGSLGAYHNRNLGAVLTPITNQQVLIMAAMGGLAGIALSYLSPSAANRVNKKSLGKAAFWGALGTIVIGGGSAGIAAWQRS